MSTVYPVALTGEERQQLDNFVRAGKRSARSITRARILLRVDENSSQPASNLEVAQALDCHANTVTNVCRRFAEGAIDAALYNKRAPERPPQKLTGDVEAQISVIACSAPPEGRAHWTVRLITQRLIALEIGCHLSRESVRLALKKMHLNPGGLPPGASALPPHGM